MGHRSFYELQTINYKLQTIFNVALILTTIVFL